MVLTKSKGPKVQTAEQPVPFLLFISHLGEESESAPGFGLTQPQELATFGLRTDPGFLQGHPI